MADLRKVGVEGFVILKNIEERMGRKLRPQYQQMYQEEQIHYVRPRNVNAGRPPRDEQGALDRVKAAQKYQQEQIHYVRPRNLNVGRPPRAEQGAIDCVKAAQKYGGILICEQRAPRNNHFAKY